MAFYALAATCCLAVGLILIGVVATILIRAAPVLDGRLLTQRMAEAGGAGGLLYQILGTLLLMASALAVSAPPAVALALTSAVYLADTRAQRWLNLWLYALNGIPSIVLGIFGLMFFMKYLEWGKSWLSGGILLGLMILPTLTIAPDRAHRMPARQICRSRRRSRPAPLADHLVRGTAPELERPGLGRPPGPRPRGRRDRPDHVHRCRLLGRWPPPRDS